MAILAINLIECMFFLLLWTLCRHGNRSKYKPDGSTL